MIRNGRTTSYFMHRVFTSNFWAGKNPYYKSSERNFATDEGTKGGKGKNKTPKGTTAKVEECLPVNTQKKIPAASAQKTCPPPPKIKIPSCAPVKPPPSICGTKTDVSDHQTKYDACKPGQLPTTPDYSFPVVNTSGGLRNPVVQVCKKPNMMEDCFKTPKICIEDTKENKKKFIKNLLISLLALSLLAFAVYKVLKKEEVEPLPIDYVPKKRTRRKRMVCKIPPYGADLPPSVPYLIIGGGTAAFSAFTSILALNPNAQVLVITNEGEFPYMRPPISKEMWFNDDPQNIEALKFKQWNGTVRSVYYESDNFYVNPKNLMECQGGVAVAKGWTVTKIDPYKREATLEDGTKISYEKCLIATGSVPKTLPIFSRSTAEVKKLTQTYRDIFDFQDLHDIVTNYDSVAVVGGGFLGTELACALARFGKNKELKVYQIFKESGNMAKVLPEYLSLWTTKKVEEEGVTVMPNSHVIDAFFASDKLNLILSNGERVLVDHCVTAIGAVPDTKLAISSDLEVDEESGGYLVNAELQARSDLYVAGDAACFFDMKLGRRRIEHHDHAIVSGKLAAENMLGARKPYCHQSMFWSDLGPEVGYEAIGIVDSSLPTVGVFAKQTPKDTPEAVVAKTDDNIRSQTEEAAAPVPPAKGTPKPPEPGEDFGKGIIFYLQDDIVVGVVMWNVFDRMNIARQVLQEKKKYENLNEVVKLFNIHEE